MSKARSQNLTEIQFKTLIKLAEFLILIQGKSVLKGFDGKLQVGELIDMGGGVKNSLYGEYHTITFDSIKYFENQFSQITKKMHDSVYASETSDYEKILHDWLKEVKEDENNSKKIFPKELSEIEIYQSILGEYNLYLKWTPNQDLASTIKREG